uniref:Uncharacterized protein n=1 Tax=Arundo donax TaxID=35708 RepID=A0A0A9D6I8_ARUDO
MAWTGVGSPSARGGQRAADTQHCPALASSRFARTVPCATGIDLPCRPATAPMFPCSDACTCINALPERSRKMSFMNEYCTGTMLRTAFCTTC